MSHVSDASFIGSLMCVMVCTRQEISHAMGVLSRYMSKLGKEHLIVVNMVFRYSCGTPDYEILYQEILGHHRDKYL
jgi:hypothetical protein